MGIRMRGVALLAAALTAVTAGCGGRSDDTGKTSARTAGPSAKEAAKKPAARTTAARTIHFRAADGVMLEGAYTPAPRPRAPAVVLVHEYRGGPAQWEPLLPDLQRAGYATLNYASRSSQEIDETVLARDVVGAVAALRRRDEIDPDRVGLVGASIGGSAVAWALGTHRSLPVRAGVGLSAVEGPVFIDAGANGRLRPHDLLLIADRKEFSQARNIRDDAHGRGVTTWMAPAAGHGVVLLSSPEVKQKLLAWLRSRLGERRG
jgi:pimeloyl-ACP methyl ester carboxylesterase